MKKNNEWAITFDVMKKDNGDESTEVYHNLEQELGTFLQEKFGNCEFVEDSPEGEEYTVRFKVFSDENPDKEDLMLGPFIIDNGLWEVVGLDIKEFKEVYIDEYFNDLSDSYQQNRTPFEDLTFRLIGEAIKCYTEELYDGVVILCRSAVDSSVYLACVWAGNKANKETYESRFPKPFEPGDEVHWNRLKNKSVELGFLPSDVIDEIEEVRDLGNFAAHIGERQLKEMIKWSKENHDLIKTFLEKGKKGLNIHPKDYPKGYKLYTSKNEAYYAIKRTVEFLKKLSVGYNQYN